jgi:hypothetical protein
MAVEIHDMEGTTISGAPSPVHTAMAARAAISRPCVALPTAITCDISVALEDSLSEISWAVSLLLEGSDDSGNGLQSGHKRGDGGDHFGSGIDDFSNAEGASPLRGFVRQNPFLNGSNCLSAVFSRFECPLGYYHVVDVTFIVQAIVGEYY